MRTYVVGGAVRDALLGLPVKDRDWVVVGATPDEMLARGFRPVGKDFPVFLHPQTQEEHALARTERKTGRGYAGFAFHTAPDVTLEEDLARRDLTINAIARDADGTLIDPCGGVADLHARVFRHVSPAFAEDPVRILRVARFAARFADFSVAPETLALMRAMVDNGEVDHLVAERVWQEFARGLMEAHPARMIRVLRNCGALARLLPELDRLFGVPQPAQHHPEIDTGEHVLMVVEQAAARAHSLPVRWAALLHDLGKGETPAAILPHHYGHEARSADLARQVSERLKAPVDCRDLAVMVAREHGILAQAAVLRAETMVKVLERCDALRRPERFALMLEAAACDHLGRGGERPENWAPAAQWQAALAAVRSVEAGAIARACADKAQVPQRIHAARVAAVKALRAHPPPAEGIS
ncbi:multifunctional tRNA nucleotidyl transferase/2'3'-cyclic phosphodiesterase/2'nucleotidase/phosphatase [Azoarcus olearius]|uniref:multifunctional CCA addition/repair protein n=1 Tax=Azoarcus sp. (strain BH72) TaxID=418699 RepID=UPI0008061133|nr:multifunctional CCA addition/repair protein [Azoarcus olearius]ANQ83579.1 multifunctional tRNA nucleotidyl transferase/2'3'-cyclic phosphodiesterase/2'nucleotidase/phosphatase [Azoarcus olearius]